MNEYSSEMIFLKYIRDKIHEKFDHVIGEPVPENILSILDGENTDGEIFSRKAD